MTETIPPNNLDVATANATFAIERTLASWLKLLILSYTIGTLAMNSNQVIASQSIGVRLTSPIFLIGMLLCLIGAAGVPYQLWVYEDRTQMFDPDGLYGNRTGIYVTSVLVMVVMVAALIGTTIYGAMEAVQVS